MENFIPKPASAMHRALAGNVPKALFLGLCFMLMSLAMMATHFRGGTITWTRVSGRTVTFTTVHSWRTGTGSPQQLNFGNGFSSSDNAVLVSSSGGYDTWRGTATHTYATDGPWTAFFSGCCRISSLQNAADDPYRLETRVCLSGGNNNSPTTSVPAVIQMAPTGQTVQLGATDADGNTTRFIFSTLAQSAISPGPMPPAGFSLTSTGALTYNGLSGYTSGMLFAIQVTVNEIGACGALVVADFIVEIGGSGVANQPPVCTLNGAANQTINVGQTLNYTLTGTDANGGNLAVTNSGLPVGATLTPTSGAAPLLVSFNWTPTLAQGGQSYPVSVTFTDPLGATSFCTFTITVNSGCQPPVVTCPGNVTVNATSGCGAIVNYPNATATGTNPVITYSQSSGTFFPVGSQVVTVNANNGCGTSQCQFTVTVVDGTAPSISCPSNISVNTDNGVCGAAVNHSASATDNCSASVSQSSGLASGSTFPVGTSTVSYNAVDPSGNGASCSFTVTVTDNEAPTINCPAAVTVNCVGDIPAANSGLLSVGDNCGVGSHITITETVSGSGCAGDPRVVVRTYSVSDVNGNNASCTQTLTAEATPVTVNASDNVVVFSAYLDSACATISAVGAGGCGALSYAWSNGSTASSQTVCPTVTTTYYVTVTDGQGCTGVDSVTVCNVDIVCSGGTNNGVKGTGQGGNGNGMVHIQVCHIPPGNANNAMTKCLPIPAATMHVYMGHGGDHLGACGSVSTRPCTGSGAHKASAAVAADILIEAFPNPFSTSTTIRMTMPEATNATMKVFDVKGTQVATLFDGQAEADAVIEVKLNSDQLSNGLYLVRLTTSTGLVKTLHITLQK